MKTILVTGSAGFIGSHFVDYVLEATDWSVIAVDKLTYAGKKENMASFISNPRVLFFQDDINDFYKINSIFEKYVIDFVVNFAAESHVDNSIKSPNVFLVSNIMGTHTLVDLAYKHWSKELNWISEKRFIQISTDEVYGSLGEDGSFSENHNLQPSSPYSSSKASADLIVLSYYKTYSFPVIITRSSNNYGPRQDAEKLIPKTLNSILNNRHVEVYGTGKNVRDWIYVKDNVKLIFSVLLLGEIGEVYNIGGKTEFNNVDIVNRLINLVPESTSKIVFINDRLGHDFRYSVDTRKIEKLVHNIKLTDLDYGLNSTLDFYK